MLARSDLKRAYTGKWFCNCSHTSLPDSLFKSDRASTDQDAEAQDPLKSAIKEAIPDATFVTSDANALNTTYDAAKSYDVYRSFLATDDSSFLTGQAIEAEGGASLDY